MTTRAERIQEYIANHPTAKRKGIVRVELNGKRTEREVYAVPWEYLIFNVRNGRLGKEVLLYEAQNQVKVDPEKAADAKVLRKLLVEQDKAASEYLMADIERVGQLEPGIVTHDGIVINANRRLAVLQTLYETKKEEKFRYLEVAILPPKVDPRDLWMIEAGLQLSRDPRLSYGPINNRLKLRSGKEAGLDPATLALAIGQGKEESDVEEELGELDLIDEYLDYFGIPQQYEEAEAKMNHFIDLRSILAKADEEVTDEEDRLLLRRVCFEHIRQDTVTHRDLRQVRKMLTLEEARSLLLSAMKPEPPPPTPAPKPATPSANKSGTASVAVQVPPTAAPATPAGVARPAKDVLTDTFGGALDIVTSKDLKEKPLRLAQKALAALKSIPDDSPHLVETEFQKVLKQVHARAAQLVPGSKK